MVPIKKKRTDFFGAFRAFVDTSPVKVGAAVVVAEDRWVLVCVGQEPAVELRIGVGVGPGVMAVFGINGQFCIAAPLVDRVHHFFGLLGEDGGVLASVEGPDGDVDNAPCIPIHSAAANRSDGGKIFGHAHGQLPGGVAAHASSRHVNAGAVGVGLRGNKAHQFLQMLPQIKPRVCGAEGYHRHKGIFGKDFRPQGYRFCVNAIGDIIPAGARSVQMKEDGVWAGRIEARRIMDHIAQFSEGKFFVFHGINGYNPWADPRFCGDLRAKLRNGDL